MRHDGSLEPALLLSRRIFQHTVFEFLEVYGDDFRYAGLLHRHSEQGVADLHCLLVVRDDDKLRVFRHGDELSIETPAVGIVQRGVDLVQETEGAWFDLKYGEDEGDRRQSLFSAAQ